MVEKKTDNTQSPLEKKLIMLKSYRPHRKGRLLRWLTATGIGIAMLHAAGSSVVDTKTEKAELKGVEVRQKLDNYRSALDSMLADGKISRYDSDRINSIKSQLKKEGSYALKSADNKYTTLVQKIRKAERLSKQQKKKAREQARHNRLEQKYASIAKDGFEIKEENALTKLRAEIGNNDNELLEKVNSGLAQISEKRVISAKYRRLETRYFRIKNHGLAPSDIKNLDQLKSELEGFTKEYPTMFTDSSIILLKGIGYTKHRIEKKIQQEEKEKYQKEYVSIAKDGFEIKEKNALVQLRSEIGKKDNVLLQKINSGLAEISAKKEINGKYHAFESRYNDMERQGFDPGDIKSLDRLESDIKGFARENPLYTANKPSDLLKNIAIAKKRIDTQLTLAKKKEHEKTYEIIKSDGLQEHDEEALRQLKAELKGKYEDKTLISKIDSDIHLIKSNKETNKEYDGYMKQLDDIYQKIYSKPIDSVSQDDIKSLESIINITDGIKNVLGSFPPQDPPDKIYEISDFAEQVYKAAKNKNWINIHVQQIIKEDDEHISDYNKYHFLIGGMRITYQLETSVEELKLWRKKAVEHGFDTESIDDMVQETINKYTHFLNETNQNIVYKKQSDKDGQINVNLTYQNRESDEDLSRTIDSINSVTDHNNQNRESDEDFYYKYKSNPP